MLEITDNAAQRRDSDEVQSVVKPFNLLFLPILYTLSLLLGANRVKLISRLGSVRNSKKFCLDNEVRQEKRSSGSKVW